MNTDPSAMRVIVNIGVVFNADTYKDAGKILDKIDQGLKAALDGRGQHEITGFQTRPCKAAKFDQMAYENTGQAMMAREPDMAEGRY